MSQFARYPGDFASIGAADPIAAAPPSLALTHR